jgi:hypothetical protein
MTFKCNRRTFLQNWALLAAGVPALPSFCEAHECNDFSRLGNLESQALQSDLEREFLAPPDWAKPRVCWW